MECVQDEGLSLSGSYDTRYVSFTFKAEAVGRREADGLCAWSYPPRQHGKIVCQRQVSRRFQSDDLFDLFYR